MGMPTGLNSPNDVTFFTKTPGEYTAGNSYFYEIDTAQNEQVLRAAKESTRKRALLRMVGFNEPTVEVHGNNYSYILRSSANREEFRAVMSPESPYASQRMPTGIQGQHYSAHERYGDAIGITIYAETPEEAKHQFRKWHAQIKEALNALSARFAIVNKEIEKNIEEAAAKRFEELRRAKKAL